MARHNCLLVAP